MKIKGLSQNAPNLQSQFSQQSQKSNQTQQSQARQIMKLQSQSEGMMQRVVQMNNYEGKKVLNLCFKKVRTASLEIAGAVSFGRINSCFGTVRIANKLVVISLILEGMSNKVLRFIIPLGSVSRGLVNKL